MLGDNMKDDIFPLIYNNKEKYVSKECIDILEKLWDLNIEAYEVNKSNNYKYIKLVNLSRNNIKKFYEKSRYDKRYYTDYRLDGQYLRVKNENINDLYDLIDIFDLQDSLEFIYDTLFLKEFNNGEIIGKYTKSTSIEDVLNQLNLEKDLYIKDEGKIYKNKIYLDWHNEYLKKK